MRTVSSTRRPIASIVIFTTVTLLAAIAPAPAERIAKAAPSATPDREAALGAAGAVRFEENIGQVDARTRFVARAPERSVVCRANDLVLTSRGGASVRMSFPGARPSPAVEGVEPSAATTNYLVGDDPSRWRTGVRSFGGVRYRDLYPGVDLLLYANGADPEYDFVLDASADPRSIRVRFDGAREVRVDGAGDLVVATASGELRHRAPSLYQCATDGSRRRVAGRYVARAADEVAFVTGAAASGASLVVDPVIGYSSYLGGAGSDFASGIAVDASGNVYVGGTAESGIEGNDGAFVTKLDPTGAIVYTTYVGGSGYELGLAIAVGSGGEAVLTGQTESPDFPVAQAAFATPGPNESDGFLVKLNASGDGFVYSTYLGGDGYDYGNGVAVDADGNVYVAGDVASSDFPANASPIGPVDGGDLFVVKVDPAGRPLYASRIGGTGGEHAADVAVDAAGRATVVGLTFAADYPTVAATQTVRRGQQDAVVTKLSVDGASAVFSTYLGGSKDDSAYGVDCGVDGSLYVAGFAFSPDFPTTPGAFQPTSGPTGGAFAAKLGADGKVAYATYVGAVSGAFDVAADADGNAVVVGTGGDADFPLVSSIKDRADGGPFVVKLDPSGASLVYSTLVGGSGRDTAFAVAIGPDGAAYVTGQTRSPDLPVTPNAAQSSAGSADVPDAFVTKIVDAPNPCRLVAPADLAATANRLDGDLPSAAVELPQPTLSGDCADVRVVCSRASGDLFDEGTTSVLCEAIGPDGIESVCTFAVTVDVPFGFCCSDDRHGDAFSMVVDPQSPLYGFWRYQFVTVTTTIVTYSGVAEQLTYDPNTRLVASGDDPSFAMTAKADFRTRRCHVTVLDHASGFAHKLRTNRARPGRCG